MPQPAAVVFLDFDGTITRCDATDAILEAFADPQWHAIEDQWVAGRIGSRECLTEQMALVKATPGDVDRLLDSIEVDPGFTVLLDDCRRQRIPVHIISDGFDYCIDRILRRPELNLRARSDTLQIVSSHLWWGSERWKTSFPHPPQLCVHGCATCKPAAMEHLNAEGTFTIFAGDGISDRHAAKCADVVFAKDRLAAFCEQSSIPSAPFDTLAAVASGIERLLRSGLPRPRPRKASPVS
jgi:2-hydroxy-3-keto-5-methylthiopentenyl-1-phosphate phosphatase